MRKLKVIHILPHTTPEVFYSSKKPVDDDPSIELNSQTPPYRICFGQEDWHVQVARETLKRTTDYEIQCWKPEIYIDRVYSKKIDGIVHKLFPSRKIQIGKYSFGGSHPSLIKEIQKEINDSNVILHFHGLFSINVNNILINLRLKKTPVIIQHHGIRSFGTKSNKNFNPFVSLIKRYEEKSLRDIDIFYILNKLEKKNLEGMGYKEVHFRPMGIDFDNFPLLDKIKCRKELGIDKLKKIILFVGRSQSWKRKGVNDLLEVANEICATKNDYSFVFIGAPINKDKIKPSKNNHSIVYAGIVSRMDLIKYYNACDLYVLPSYDEGLPVSLLEALSLNIKSISTDVGGISLIKEKVNSLKLISPGDKSKLKELIVDSLENEQNGETRSSVMKSFSWTNIIKSTVEDYQNLERRYYRP